MRTNKTARRPTKLMMLAVNAAMEGEVDEVDRLIEENQLDREELDQRLLGRNGDKYTIPTRKNGTTPKRRPRRPNRTLGRTEIEITIDGRTSVRTLFRLIEETDRIRSEAQQELKRRPESEIEPVKRALADIELLRRERFKLEEKIRVAEDAIG